MKKKLFLALLTALLLLLASSYALAENYPTHSCDCGENTWSTWKYSSEAQHYSFCIGCGAPEYGDHYGGMATCIAQAICEGCGSAYGTTGNKHFNLSGWEYFNDALHTRFCLDCGAPDTKEFGSHSGSNGSCIAFCDDCGSRYLDLNGKHNMSGWIPYDDTQHYRYCLDCNHSSTYEYASHTGGTATCNEQAVCEGCYATYGELDPNNHDWGDWFWLNASTHLRECRDCPASEEGKHTGGMATCMTHAICEVCNDAYGERDTTRHGEYSGWGYYNGTQHYRWCLDCSDPVSYEYEDHYGGTATCSVPAFCEGCGQPYGPYGDHSGMTGWVPYSDEQHYRRCLECGSSESFEYEDHYGGTATCQTLASCEGCGASYGEPDPSKHTNMSDWNYASDTQHFRYCLDCVDPVSYEYEGHTGGDSSCLPVCEECHQRYIAPNGKHSNMCDWFYNDAAQHRRYCLDCGTYESNEYEDHYGGTATCTKRAVCEGCGTEYGERSDVHPWGEWEYLDGTNHERRCTNPDCYASDYANHSGGDGSCWTECEDCGYHYNNAEGQHRTMSVWYYLDGAQHMRHCVDCGYGQEYEDHSGGTATCTEDGVCEVCKAAYIPALQHSWGEWKPNGNGTHTRVCANDATHTETEDCTGGDGSCRPICEGCGTQYNNANGEHRNTSDWFPYSGTQHFRYCQDCDQYEYANHHGGDGSCTPFCADCSMLYSDENGEHRNVTDWIFVNNDRHFRYCPDCGSSSTYEYADHSGGKANCTEKAVCEGCGKGYGELAPDDHDWGEWKSNGNGKHTRVCANDATHTETEDCTGGNATCTEDGVCEVCDSTYMSAINHSWGEWKSNGNGTHTRVCANDADHTETGDCTGGKASCTEDGVCEVCEAAYIPAIQHSWGEWKPNGNGTHTRVCANDATHTETEDCTGGTASCTDKAICEVCGSEHGAALGHIPGAEADCTNDQFCTREGCGELLTEKLGHDYTAVVTKPTCTENGYTTYTCSRCEESYQVDQTAARGHWYDLWYPNQDGTHSAKCKRYGCRHEGTTECTLYEITVKDGEDEVILTVCPVCGDHETAAFSVMSGATIKNVFINQPLPHGEQIVRELDAPFNGVLYAFTAAYESAGRVVPFNGKVSVSLPLDAEKYAEFRLVRVDVTPATETTERTEVWTDVAFTFENGRLTFETDVAGLFLLVPME